MEYVIRVDNTGGSASYYTGKYRMAGELYIGFRADINYERVKTYKTRRGAEKALDRLKKIENEFDYEVVERKENGK